MRSYACMLAVLVNLWVISGLPGGGFEASESEWTIPIVGNVFQTDPSAGGRDLGRRASLSWQSEKEQYSIYFHVDRPATLEVQLVGSISPGAKIKLSSVPSLGLDATLDSENLETFRGQIQVQSTGYVRLDVIGLEKGPQQSSFAELQELVVSTETADVTIDYVRDNDGNMFYWGRRGPSVHLSYQVPRDKDIQFGYTELTVPEGQDPIGSYFMANGFAEGYFGMQVNSDNERRILFSVWSPYETDDPNAIPADQRIELLAKGSETRVGQFGNEGSGGQSYMVYPWKSGQTYRFLTEVKPLDANNTQYTCWFSQVEKPWRLVASFRRPKTSTYLRRFHSFLENFNPATGYVERRCDYGNVWVVDADGSWIPCTEARFSVDATGGKRYRLDYAGGADGSQFYLKNCGFFSGDVKAGTALRLTSVGSDHPDINFQDLPRK